MIQASKKWSAERRRVHQAAKNYTSIESVQMQVMRQLTIKTFSPFISSRANGLELGCSDGYMTEMLARRVAHLDVVDASKQFLDATRQRGLSNVRLTQSLFETFETDERYDCVFASYVLEHVLDPVSVLERVRSLLAPGGRIFIVVPNARAFSRQLALHMGLLRELKELTRSDLDHGHRRVYDRPQLNRDLEAAGLQSISEGGILLKFLADFQLDELIERGILTKAHIEGLYRLGLEYPEFCSAVFSICEVKS
jgi:2-polyprenyl-3-methyl-5-hydroxy-6-metoxy-1,4-benzoquinol methylase